MPSSLTQLGRLAIAMPASAALSTSALGTWQDEIGYSRLVQELGSSTPRGAGVSVSLVEARLTQDGGEYLPSVDPAPVSGNFAGKIFDFRSGPSPVSFHAVRAGAFFFGVNTNPLAGDASVAPLAGSGPSASVHCYQADPWLRDDLLRLGSSQRPRPEPQDVSNHSWIATVGQDLSAAQATDALRRLDWTIATSDHLAVVGLNNGAATPVPALLGSAFNVLSVGRTDGAHSSGTTAADVDGPGRIKPELVAPMTTTSWATAVVSSCAALLMDAGQAVAPEARRSDVMRAVLLAGARKEPFPGWANTQTSPLDPHYGAGEINVWRSHRVLLAGAGSQTSGGLPNSSGWQFVSSIAPGASHGATLRIAQGCVARELAAALVWNRQVTLSGPLSWTNPQPVLPNLDLKFVVSTEGGSETEWVRSESGAGASVSHPLEYIFRRSVPAGNYALRVENALNGSAATGFALAWFIDVAPAAAPDLTSVWSPDSQSVALTITQLGIGLTYELQHSADLLTWDRQQSITATGTSHTLVLADPPNRAFFRVVWVPQPGAAAASL